MRTGPSVRTRGYSLAELVGVLTVLAVLAATAVPAVSLLGDTKAAEVALRLEDVLRQARAAAIARGIPCGVRFDIDDQTVALVALEEAQVVPMLDALGEPVPDTMLGPGASIGIDQVTGGARTGNNAEIWFDAMGSHADVDTGGDVFVLPTDATITLTTGAHIFVRGNTGLIE